jgi:hypothetical protein
VKAIVTEVVDPGAWEPQLRIEALGYYQPDRGDLPPEDAVEVPPDLLNRWQRAMTELRFTEGLIWNHLRDSGQRP